MAEGPPRWNEKTGVTDQARFILELEFVQCLASPQYLNWLAQNKYFEDQAFLNYLKYMEYWRKLPYVTYIRFPHCLFMLELLQSEHFRKAIASPAVMEELHTQQFFYWQHYRGNRIKDAAEEASQQKEGAGQQSAVAPVEQPGVAAAQQPAAGQPTIP